MGRDIYMAVKSFASEMNGYSNPHFDHKDENIADIQSKVNRLEIVVNALWEVLKENDIGEDRLKAKIDEIIKTGVKGKRPSYEPVIVRCPRCGKAIQESRNTPLVGRCMYCGEQVVFYPFSDSTSVDYPPESTDDTQE